MKMVKTLLLAEKPDQARSFYLPLLKEVCGERFEKQNGYFESGSFFLSWFFGHLLEALMPDEYDSKYKKWTIKDLPIIPESMRYKFKDGAKKQGQIIKKLCQKSDRIICGTDPDREGQGIFDTFMRFYGINKPMMRLWATSLAPKDLRKAWERKKPMQEYALLSAARELRADSDWLVGMNASRVYSILAKDRIPIGRVLTATLALIVKQDHEVEHYKESFYYRLRGKWNGIEFSYFDETGTKFDDPAVLEPITKACATDTFNLTGFSVEAKMENPPKPFSLPDLQKEANRGLGYSLDKTLDLCQSLYEKKLVTYPRTDSVYLPESDLNEYHRLLRSVATQQELPFIRTSGSRPPCVRDTDSPHSALIVTGEKPSSMTEDERNIYKLIRARFVCAFMVPRTYEQFGLEISNDDGLTFKAIIRKDINSGFRNLYKEEQEDGVQDAVEKPDKERLKQNPGPIRNCEIQKIKRSRPKYYTPATLITAMQTCGRTLENQEARRMLGETKGIGTPATQAHYPKQLIKYGYIMQKNGSYISLPKGRKLILTISPDLKTPELTAEWEMKLRLVEQGRLSSVQYRKELNEFIRKIIKDAVNGNSMQTAMPQ